MAWRSSTATGSLASIFGLALLVGSGCSGDGDVHFDPVGDTDGVGASGGATATGGGTSSAGTPSSGATSGSGGSGDEGGGGSGGADTAGTNTGGTETGGTETGGTETGGTDTGGSHRGGTGGTGAGGTPSGGTAGAGGKGGEGGSGGPSCTVAQFGGHTYSFCGAVASGDEAFALCEKLGMVLVSIESKAENDFLVSKLTGTTWIGASDDGHEGVWHWPSELAFWDQSDDQKGPIPGRYHNWQEGQPNNSNDDGLDENCAILQISGAAMGTWNDLACGIETDFRATCESTGPIIGPFP